MVAWAVVAHSSLKDALVMMRELDERVKRQRMLVHTFAFLPLDEGIVQCVIRIDVEGDFGLLAYFQIRCVTIRCRCHPQLPTQTAHLQLLFDGGEHRRSCPRVPVGLHTQKEGLLILYEKDRTRRSWSKNDGQVPPSQNKPNGRCLSMRDSAMSHVSFSVAPRWCQTAFERGVRSGVSTVAFCAAAKRLLAAGVPTCDA